MIDCTLITAIYDLTKYNNNCNKYSSLINSENYEILMSLPVYMVIYTNNGIGLNILKPIRDKYKLSDKTLFIEKELEELEIYKYVEKVRYNREMWWATRDNRTCAESHIICCNKFKFVLDIIELNPFNTSKFGWIDGNAGVKIAGTNNIKICENYESNKILYVLNNITDKFHIQIMNVCDKKYKLLENKREYYEQYRWVVCGCFFTCSKLIGQNILSRLYENFIATTELGYGHGEEMLYLEILDEYYDDIYRSYGDYGQIINNFIEPRLC